MANNKLGRKRKLALSRTGPRKHGCREETPKDRMLAFSKNSRATAHEVELRKSREFTVEVLKNIGFTKKEIKRQMYLRERVG